MVSNDIFLLIIFCLAKKIEKREFGPWPKGEEEKNGLLAELGRERGEKNGMLCI